jgi:hypothetical protein
MDGVMDNLVLAGCVLVLVTSGVRIFNGVFSCARGGI